YFAFLDINPNTKGHTRCIPKKEVDKLRDLDEETYLGLMQFSRKVGKAIEKAIPCKRVGLTVIGLEVPHVHVHLTPPHRMESVRYLSKESLSQTELEEIAAAIRAQM